MKFGSLDAIINTIRLEWGWFIMDTNQILLFLKNTKDEPRNLENCVDILTDLQRTKGAVLEVITLLKFEKPLLHSLLKPRLKHNTGLSMLLNLSMDYEQAREKLGIKQ